MKKIIILMLITSFVFPASAQVTSSMTNTPIANPTFTPGSHIYYYYPSKNIYADKANGNYWYKEKPSSTTWKLTRTLPSQFDTGKSPKYKLDYKGRNPWENNKEDIIKYKVKESKSDIDKTKKPQENKH